MEKITKTENSNFRRADCPQNRTIPSSALTLRAPCQCQVPSISFRETVSTMASPPNLSPATSPPLLSHIPTPGSKKRPSLAMPSHGPSLKRQKRSSVHSTTSALSAHPLRQTSFPPEESALDTGARSPSIESDFTALTGSKSVHTNATGKRGRGKGKRKVEGSVKSAGREKTAEAAREGTGEAPDEDEEDDDGGEEMVDDGEVVDAEAEVKKMA